MLYYSREALGESWKYSTGQKDGVQAFGYNSTESKPIWIKFGTLWGKYLGLAPADFGCDPRSSDSLRVSRIFCLVNNARIHRFRVGKIITTFEHNNVNRCRQSPCKLSEQNFENFTLRGCFSKKNLQKLLTKFPDLATAVITAQ